MIWLFVVIRIIANPFSNVFQKILTRKRADPLAIICLTHGLLSLACLPWVLCVRLRLHGAFWINISICAVLAVAANTLIVAAVKRSDLSLLGPINAYKAIVSLIPGMIFLREFPGAVGLSGMGLIVAGSYLLVDRSDHSVKANAFVRFFNDRGVQYRFAALVLSATEAVFLKKALLASSPMATFVFWCILGFAVSLPMVMIMGTNVSHELRVFQSAASTVALLFVSTGLMQYCTIVTLAALHVGYALALFQMSTLISVFLGYHVFQEKHFFERMIGSIVMIAGAVLVICGG
jgi:drug/metabolite transporter (DMT)-like permease